MGEKELPDGLLTAVQGSVDNGEAPPADVVAILRDYLAEVLESAPKGDALDRIADKLISAWTVLGPRSEE